MNMLLSYFFPRASAIHLLLPSGNHTSYGTEITLVKTFSYGDGISCKSALRSSNTSRLLMTEPLPTEKSSNSQRSRNLPCPELVSERLYFLFQL